MRDLMAARGVPPRRVMAFTVGPEVIVNNALSDQFTVIEVAGRDRPGLLYELTSTMSNLFLDITSAHITTFGEKAVDVFYVTDLTGKKITGEQRQSAIREQLVKVLEGAPEKPTAEPAAKA
jgi:[protein-PII] uridylyltransferase